MNRRHTAPILGPDPQGLISKVVWTFLQTFLAILISVPALDLDIGILRQASVSGLAACVVPITVYAREITGTARERYHERQIGGYQPGDEIIYND